MITSTFDKPNDSVFPMASIESAGRIRAVARLLAYITTGRI
jgi:hypothetical protein